MADAILRHRAFPPGDASENGISRQLDNLAKLVAKNADNISIGGLENLFVTRAADEAAQEGTVFRSPVGKLVMHKRGGEHAFPLAAGHKKTEARRERRAHTPVVAEIDRNRRCIANAAKFGGKFRTGQC